MEKAHKLAPGEDYVLKHLQIVQNRISKLKINPNTNQLENIVNDNEVGGKRKVVSSKSFDETERKTEPVVSGDSEEQQYSSRVVNTEPMFVKNIEHIEYPPFVDDEDNYSSTLNDRRNFSKSKYLSKTIGTDSDDPSSGMS